MTAWRNAAVVALAGALVLYLAARQPNHPQAGLTSTDPADGAVLALAPAEVELSFTAPVIPDLSHVSVQDSSGTALSTGRPRPVLPERLRQPVNITATGDVRVVYHVTFVHGAELTGTLHFTVGAPRAAGSGVTTAPAANTDDAVAGSTHQHGVDPISGALLALDGIVALAALVLLMRRPNRPGRP
jgi:methionine-rich copper-binding protein CopC